MIYTEGNATHFASPTKSSAEKVSLSMILRLSSGACPEIVNTNVSFHSGVDP